MSRSGRLCEVFVELADTLVDDFDVVDLMETLAARTAELVDEMSTGLLLADPHGRLRLVAASPARDGLSGLVDLLEGQGAQGAGAAGPAVESFRDGVAVTEPDLGRATARWPDFAPSAVEQGLGSVHAFPLRLRGERIGALVLLGHGHGPLVEQDAVVVQALADVATIGLLQQRTIHEAERLTEQLQRALHSRVAIEQAKGVLSQIHTVTPDEAFDLLRAWCRSHNRRLSEVAFALVADPRAYPELTTPGSGG